MEQSQMSKFCIELEGMMLPDAIAAVVEAWYEAQNTQTTIGEGKKEEKYYTVQQLEKVLKRSRATIYRILNTNKDILNPLFDPYKLNHEYRVDPADPIRVSSLEIDRWKNNPKPIYVETKSEKTCEASCKQQALDYVSRLINAKLLAAGDKMPSLRDLANRIGFHRNTVLKAYVELEQDGAIIAKPGSGYYISDINRFVSASVI
jgi:biotin operon repressor